MQKRVFSVNFSITEHNKENFGITVHPQLQRGYILSWLLLGGSYKSTKDVLFLGLTERTHTSRISKLWSKTASYLVAMHSAHPVSWHRLHPKSPAWTLTFRHACTCNSFSNERCHKKPQYNVTKNLYYFINIIS